MKITARIVLLLVVLTSAFVAVLCAFARTTDRRLRTTSREIYDERAAALDGVLELSGSSLAGFVYDYTCWDEMVSFVSRPDTEWTEDNIATSVATFGACAAWVYAPDGRLVYSYGADGLALPPGLPVPDSARTALLRRRHFCHFYVGTAAGLLEVRGATIHPTDDVERRTLARGEFFAARVWDSAYVAGLGRLTRSRLQLVDAREPAPDSMSALDAVCIDRALAGWTGEPIARLQARSTSPALAWVGRSSGRDFRVGLVFALAVCLLLAVILERWVRRPLARISDSLATGNAGPVASLRNSSSEFGNIARLITSFFGQQKELESHRSHLEELVAQRTAELTQAHSDVVRVERLAALGQVAGSVAHEIRNPLGAIRNAAYYLKRLSNTQFSAKAARHLDIIDEQTERANDVITSLLEFARGRQCERHEYRFGDIVAGTLERLQLPSGIRVETDISSDLPPVLVDAVQVSVVLQNLLTNASDAMNAQGVIRIAGAMRDGAVRVSVSDSGAGIEPEHMARLFEPLFSTKMFGVGLGLAIAKTYVEANGGTITAESEVGKGSTFSFSLPVCVS